MPHMDMQVDYHVWYAMLNTIKDTHQSWTTPCRAKKPFCQSYRMFCLTSSLIRQLYHFATDFDRLLLQLAGTDIVSTLFKCRVNFKRLTFIV